jgi:hypothetical protein
VPVISDAEQSAAIGDDEFLIRFIPRAHYKSENPEGFRVELANLNSTQFQPTDKKQPSVYLESKCSVVELEGACAKWRDQGVARIRARALRDLGLEVRLSPEHCRIQSIQHAHTSILGVTKDNRQAVIALFDRCIIRPPP